MSSESQFSVKSLMVYIMKYEEDIFVRAKVEGKWQSIPLAEADPFVWAEYVYSWIERGIKPARVLGRDEIV